MPMSPATRRNMALIVICAGPLLAGCQTAKNGQAVATGFAQNRGWVVERIAPPNEAPYCIAYRPSGLQDLTFLATSNNTGVALSRVGVTMQPAAVYDFNVSFDGGQTHGLKSKQGGSMLVAPLGDSNIGKHLGRFATAGSVTVSAPALGIRKRYDLEGSTWAISKLSECVHGAPARFPKTAAAPTKPGAQPRPVPPTDVATPPVGAPPAPATPTAPTPAPAPAAPAPSSGGTDLDMDIKQGVDLD